MKSKRFLALAELSNFIMIYLLFAAFGEIWDMIYKRPYLPILPVGIFMLLLFSYTIRTVFNSKKFLLNNFAVYAILHVFPLLLVLFLPFDFLYKLFLFGIFMLLLITDLKSYFETKGEGFSYISVIFVLIPAFAYLFSDIFDFPFAMKYFFVIGVLYVLFHYLRLFFENAYFLSIEKKNNEKMPLDDMLKNDSKLAVPFIVMSFLIMVLTKIEVFDKITLFLYLKFARFVGFMIEKITELADYLYDLLFGDAEDVTMRITFEEITETQESSAVFNIISGVMFFVVLAIVIFVFIKIILSIIKSVMVKKEVNTMTIEDEGVIEIREKIVRKKAQKKENLSKIRKLYKKTIIKNIKKGYELKTYQTPRERAEDINKMMSEDIFELNALYEKERYGQVND